MTTYSKITDYASKDALLTGNPSKIIKGVEIGAEFDSIAAADATSVKTGGAASVSSVNDSGNLTFTGTGNRITGDFSNATVANSVMFQTSTVNSLTVLAAIPSGTGNTTVLNLWNSSDPTNATRMQIAVTASEARLLTDKTGTGTYLPMTFYTGGSERLRIDTSGNVLVTGSGGLGYGTGSGGTVTQATSKATAVTLNKTNGQIAMNNAALAANTSVRFAVTNSSVAASDVIIVNLQQGFSTPSSYRWQVESIVAGTFYISVTNTTAGSLSEGLVLNFAVIKAVTA
jgi:hypothetical protein